MKIPVNPILFFFLGAIVTTSVTAYALLGQDDDVVIKDFAQADGTSLTVATAVGEATILFAQETTGDAWRFRIQPASEGLSIVKETGGSPGEKIRFLENGDILTTGNIIPSGDICIGSCP